jgi:poly(A) polymerase
VWDYFAGLADLEVRRVRFIGDPFQRIAEDHLRILRFFRFHARFGQGDADADGLAACAARANDLMALSRERIADEVLKLLALPGPEPTVALMEQNGIFRPVVPEIDHEGVARLVRLCEREKAAGVARDPLRRLAALLPPDGAVAASVATRLRLSNKAAKRLAGAPEADAAMSPEQLAYRVGAAAAIDAILLGDADPVTAQRLEQWQRPPFAMGGGQLIAMGLPQGPVVARTLVEIERQWVEEGFPDKGRLQEIARGAVDQALRSSQ